MTSTSPLRYPGGKARFTNFITDAIATSREQPKIFVEPFCGEAGAALTLFENKYVRSIVLNNVDPLAASFWKIVFGKSNKNRSDIKDFNRNRILPRNSINAVEE